jgi:hypothetical protein
MINFGIWQAIRSGVDYFYKGDRRFGSLRENPCVRP